jgi:AAA ATPase domain
VGPVFVGRQGELEQLRAGLEDAIAGRGRLFLLSGEPGMGKSRLADEFAGRARGLGARVLSGRCWEAGGAPPYWPWVQLLRSYLRSEDRQTIRSEIAGGAADLVRMLPEVRDYFSEIPESPSRDPESARFQLFDATAGFLRSAASARPILLLLEDLHAADTPSLLLLRFLADQLQDSRILVLATYRDVELTPDHALTATLAELEREPATRRLFLQGLDNREVMRFVEVATGSAPRHSVAAALRRTSNGNPLFLGETVRLLVAEGRLGDLADLTILRVDVPQQIRDVISKRAGHLSDDCRQALVLASVFGPEFTVESLRRLDDTSADLLESIREAERAKLIHETVPGSFRFAHELIRQTFYADLEPRRRIQLHLRAALALEDQYRADPEPHLAELAHHFFEAATSEAWERAVTYARAAGDEAVRSLAYEEAVRLYAIAAQAMELGEPGTQEYLELLLSLGDVEARSGDLPGAQRTFLRAAAIARRLGDARGLGRAALGYGGRFVWARVGTDTHLIPMLQDALALLAGEEDHLRVRLLSRLACALRSDPDRERGAALSQQAVELAEELGDPSTLAYALEGRWGSIWWPENAKERLHIAEELVRVGEEAGDMERIAAGVLAKHVSYADLGAMQDAKAGLEVLGRRTRELRQPSQAWLFAALRAEFALLQGRFAEAEALIDEAVRTGYVTPVRDHVSVATHQTFLLRREQGRSAEVEASLRAAADEFVWYPLYRGALACLLLDLGRADEARASISDLVRTGFEFPHDNEWLLAACHFAQACAGIDDTAAAAVLLEQLLPLQGNHAIGHAEGSLGNVDRYIGLLERCLGELDSAERHFESAIAANGLMGARPWVGHTQHDLAELLMARDGPGDRVRAAELLRKAGATCESVGMPALGAKVATLLKQLGLGVQAAISSAGMNEFRREGEYWTVSFDGETVRLHDSKGLRYLARLLERPGTEVHALDLVRAAHAPETGAVAGAAGSARVEWADAGELLDERAKTEYRRRVKELEEERDEAHEWNDPEREARAAEELEFIAQELASAVGLGGRDRRAASTSERARVNVTRAIKAAFDRLDDTAPKLAAHLRSTVRTGTFCVYEPDPRVPITWRS